MKLIDKIMSVIHHREETRLERSSDVQKDRMILDLRNALQDAHKTSKRQMEAIEKILKKTKL